jgi:aryl-alcohol dehydrogenase-like predicted oxidoreductase
LSGAATPEALGSNLAAAGLDLPEDALDELATLEEPADRYWTARGELAWT